MNLFAAQLRELIEVTRQRFQGDKLKDRDLEITLKHYGFDGLGGESLESIGNKYKLTRERVRQIAARCAAQLEVNAKSVLVCLPEIAETIQSMAPASVQTIEKRLSSMGYANFSLEGLVKACTLFTGECKRLRLVSERGTKYVILPDMEGVATKVNAQAQKRCSHLGLLDVPSMLQYVPGVEQEKALSFIRDVLDARGDAVWLDGDDKAWVWLKGAPRNRLITCLHKILHVFSSTTAAEVIRGANRYYRKGNAYALQLEAPTHVVECFVKAWGEASCSEMGVIRKTNKFKCKAQLLELEASLAEAIEATPEKMMREKDLENLLVPLVNGETHPKKYNFSIALNYSPLVCKGPRRGEYVNNGSI